MATPPKILVIDDDVFIVNLIEKTLSKTGYQIIKAFDGEEALKTVEEEVPDLIILDLMMPKMDGLEVCRRLRANESTSLIPIVMLTAQNYIEDKITGLESGVDDYIVKPFIVKEFVARIRGLVDKKIYQHKKAEEEKLVAIENLLESVAHEVRNPIVAIGGFARRISDRMPQGDMMRNYADLIFHEAQRLETMVNEIVKLKAVIIINPVLVDTREIINSALDDFIVLIHDRHITIVKDYIPEMPLIRGDVKNLGTAFSHIIANALDAMESGGTLTVSIGQEEQNVFLRFADTGRGIPHGDIEQVVRPFFTSKMSGAGMGLTMVKHIVKLHEGDLSIASKKGEGTQVTILLPIPADSKTVKTGSAEA